jgi:hypothetical protein
MRDAIGDAVAAVARWRAGYSLSRDDSGGEVLTVGDDFGNVGALWIKTTFPPVRVKKGESASEAVARVQAAESVSEVVAGYCGGRRVAFVKRQVKDMAAFIAWRALVDSVTDDNLGESASVQAAAADFYAWAAMANNIGDMSRLIFEGLTVEHRNARRLARVEQVFDRLASGRGRRKQLAAKAKHATLLMLNGTSGDAAAVAAGFKGSKAGGGSGEKSASNRMASALRRAGVRVVAKRGNFAQAQELNEFEAAAKRGGAAVDLVSLFSFPLRKFYPWRTFTRKPRRGAVSFVPPSSAVSARVVGLHPLSKASSGLPSAAAASVDLASLPASRVQLRRALAASSRRKLQGVLRVKPAPAPASAGDDTAAAARVAALVAADESGQAYIASLAAATAAAAKAAAAAVIAAASLSSSVELRRVWVSGVGQTYEGASVAGWFPFRALRRGASFVGFVRVADFKV